MNRSTAVLGVALAASLLLNIVMLGRGRESTPDRSETRSARPARAEGKGDVATSDALAAELEREKKITRELRDTIKRLEADHEVLAQAATSGAPVAAAKSPTAGLREKLRKMKKLFKSAEDGLQPDQEAMLDMSGEIMEVMKLGLARGKDPRSYAEFVQACAEISLEDDAALTPAQTGEYARILQEMGDALGKIPASTSLDHLIRELEVESSAFARLQDVLTPAQKDVMKKQGVDDMATMSSSMSTSYLSKGTAEDTVVKAWTQSFKLQDAQLPAARAAAASFVRELEGMKAGTDPANFGVMSYESRIAALRAQTAALKTLEGAMTATQFERLGTQPPREFRFMDFGVVAAPPPPEKK
jgi:hypothetical protein